VVSRCPEEVDSIGSRADLVTRIIAAGGAVKMLMVALALAGALKAYSVRDAQHRLAD
jgi:hypothetical protein